MQTAPSSVQRASTGRGFGATDPSGGGGSIGTAAVDKGASPAISKRPKSSGRQARRRCIIGGKLPIFAPRLHSILRYA